MEPIIVSQGSVFNEVDNVGDYNVTEYRSYLTNDFYTNMYPGHIISNSCTITLVWKNTSDISPTQAELDFIDLINKIEMLENISKQYNVDKNSTKDPYVRALQYIRQSRYGSMQWTLVAGSVENDFSQYVTDHQIGYTLSELQTLNTFTNIKSGKDIDFVHMMATLNTILKSGSISSTASDLAGWGGDICQFAKELKDSGKIGDELTTYAIEKFNSTSSTFSSSDLNADIDAINIASIYYSLSENKSISNAIKLYYNSFTTKNQKVYLLLNTFTNAINSKTGEISITKTKFINEINERITSNWYLTTWCSSNDLIIDDSVENNDIEQLDASINAFVSYLID